MVVESSEARHRRTEIPEHQEIQDTLIKDNVNYRRHKGACPYYRENWSCESSSDSPGGQLLYQIICLMDTPPVTPEEQHRCLHSPTVCWRLAAEAARRNGRNGRSDVRSVDERGDRAGEATAAG